MRIAVASSASTLENIIQLIGIAVAFALILIATYYVTKWIGKSGVAGGRSRNIKVIETYKVSQNNFIQILKIGGKYVAVGVGKDQVTLLTELDGEDLLTEEPGGKQTASFKDILTKISDKYTKKE